ncbi:RHS repeat protein [Salmonella enterica]|nr:RHS repeat protein [Salmonella enterica]
MSTSLFRKTPTVTVLDNRGLTVRDIAYHRHPGAPDVTSERITRHQYDARGFLAQSTDPRLHDAGLANFTYITDLAGNVLRSQGVDNGTAVVLNDAAGRMVLAVGNVRTADDGSQDLSQAVTRTWQYEAATLPGRLLSITEQVTGGPARISERFVYAGCTSAEQGLNLAGACVGHYDTAGLAQTDSIALTGAALSVTRRLLKDADNPDIVADWQGADASAWNDLLATEAYTTLSTADATGAALTTTDAKGNIQRVAYDVAGQLSGSWLTVAGGTEQVIVGSLTYSAAGQKLREEHGNGVVTTYTYEAETQRLTGIKTERPAGHASGAKVLQDLRYEYDPVGNVLKVRNDTEATRFWRNQKVVPESTYAYDSLYQLVSATGREMADAGRQGSGLPPLTVLLPANSGAYTNYTRTWAYDTAGNLTQISHSAPATNNSYTTSITVSDRSNRGVLSTLTETPSEVEGLFTTGGQQLQLLPGQALGWTPRNELLRVTPVVREGDVNDEESYRYDAGSLRVLKVSRQLTRGSTQTKRALYLPGLELRSTASGRTETERLRVMTVGEAGRAQVRVLHWESGVPDGISNDQVRYSYDNLIGSSQLELDTDGNIISMEEYYPYGGTSAWTARNEVEADYKTIRYSGQERDATGLYYYGYRYYQPWAGRWLSSDPAGTVDGLNLYAFVGNNPLRYIDNGGLGKEDETQASGKNVSADATEQAFTRSPPSLGGAPVNNRLAVPNWDWEINRPTGLIPGRSVPSGNPDVTEKAGIAGVANSDYWHELRTPSPRFFNRNKGQYIYGSDRPIVGIEIQIPLRRLERRKSFTQRPINIISGTHGSAHGNEWDPVTDVRYRGYDDINGLYVRPAHLPPGAPNMIGDLIEPQFFQEDQRDYGPASTLFSNKFKKRIRIYDADGMTRAQFNALVTDPNAHAIIGCCFSRNDEALRDKKGLAPVTSYLSVPGQRPTPYTATPQTQYGDPQAPNHISWR